MADENPFRKFILAEAAKLREGDVSPNTRVEWEKRRKTLVEQMAKAIGPIPDKPCDLEARNLGTLERDGYKIEKIVFQSRPDVWVTANAYVPAITEKVPAVLVVHGHWAGARRDPVVQARCLGLVKLGFFVLAVDAFGAGERYTKPAKGTYHGALYGATLWPTGHSLLGMQVYDNRRAVDYLLTRKEVNGKLGITGASGGGNQSMNAGALDDRIQAVVPVCSVGNYQSYLHTACCVCEVLPGALKFTEEGDVLGLVAPRALLVMTASRDGIQFSPAEAAKSVARAKDIYKLHGEEAKLKHIVFDSGHDYNKAMREAMYGWMTLHLKGEGRGEPIPEPDHKVETAEDLACYPNPDDRPKGFLTPPLFAGKVGRELVAKIDKLAPTHPEMWEATANGMRDNLNKILGEIRSAIAKLDADKSNLLNVTDDFRANPSYWFIGEGGLPLPTRLTEGRKSKERSAYVLLRFDGNGEIEKHAIAERVLSAGKWLISPFVRATGVFELKGGAIAGAPDHHSAEYGVWIGRPLFGQWASDVLTIGAYFGKDEESLRFEINVAAIGHAALVALLAAGLFPKSFFNVVLVDPPTTFVTDSPYASGTPMGILAPGILKVGDIPHLAALIAPRRLIIAGGTSPQGKKLSQKELEEAFRFTSEVYKTLKAAEKLTIVAEPDWGKIEI